MKTYDFWLDFDLTRRISIEAASMDEAETKVNAMNETELMVQVGLPVSIDAQLAKIELVDGFEDDDGGH